MNTKKIIKNKVIDGKGTMDLIIHNPKKKHTICIIALYNIDSNIHKRIDKDIKKYKIKGGRYVVIVG